MQVTENITWVIKFREYDFTNRRDGIITRVITRAADNQREAENKAKIFSPNCRIISCKPKEDFAYL